METLNKFDMKLWIFQRETFNKCVLNLKAFITLIPNFQSLKVVPLLKKI